MCPCTHTEAGCCCNFLTVHIDITELSVGHRAVSFPLQLNDRLADIPPNVRQPGDLSVSSRIAHPIRELSTFAFCLRKSTEVPSRSGVSSSLILTEDVFKLARRA